MDPIERAKEIAKDRTHEILKTYKGYGHYDYDSIYTEQLEKAKKEMLDDIDFNNKYTSLESLYNMAKNKEELSDMQMELARQKKNDSVVEGMDNYWKKSRQKRAEEEFIEKDFEDLKINKILDSYKSMADYFCINDANEFHKIMNDNSNVVNFEAIEKIIDSPKGKARLRKISSIPDFSNKEKFVSLFSQALEQLSNSRVNTQKGFMEAAEKNVSVRTDGISNKMDAYKKFKENSLINEDVLNNSIEDLQRYKNTLDEEIKNKSSLKK